MPRWVDRADKVLSHSQTILAVMALVCLVAGSCYDSQVYTYLSQAPEPPETRTLTVTVASTISTNSTCTIHPCTYNVTLTERATGRESLSGNVTHIAAQKAAQAAWYWKTQFSYWGTVLLVVYLVVLGIRGIRYVGRRYARSMKKPSGNPNSPNER